MKRTIGITLITFSFNLSAQNVSMAKEQWLEILKPILVPHLCAQHSPFIKGYKGNDCQADVASLFEKCTTQVKNVTFPMMITNVVQAKKGSQVISECINAHYYGGQLLQAFNMIQGMSKP